MTYKPNYQNIVDVALNRKPQRIPLYEHYVSYNMIEKITNTQLSRYYWRTPEELQLMFANYTAFFRDYGYDAVSFECSVTDILPHGGALSGSGKGYIDSQETFDAYPWESVKELYINRFKPYFDALAESMPDGMKAIGGVGNGVFEIVQDLVGYENLCIFSFEEPELYASLFEKVGQILYEIWQWFLKNYSDVYCICRFGDDLGYKSNTLLSHEDIRKHIIPQYTRIVDLVHQYGRPFLLHSCGKIFAVMEDLIDVVKIDAKHSNEDQIAEMSVWVERYGDRIGNFGGIDTDHLARMDNDLLKKKVEDVYRLAEQKNGGFAIGSGNSIPDYVDVEKYLLMINTVRTLRGDFQ